MKNRLAKNINLTYKNKRTIMLVLCIIVLFFLALFNTNSYANVGDLDGNGKITITDLTKLKLHLSKIKDLENEYIESADINGDEKVSITDLTQLNLTVLGIKDYIALRTQSSTIEETSMQQESEKNTELTEDNKYDSTITLTGERELIKSTVFELTQQDTQEFGIIQNGNYIIRFNANGGQVTPYYVSANIGDEITIPTATRSYTLIFNSKGGSNVENKQIDGNFLGWYAVVNNRQIYIKQRSKYNAGI